MQQFHIQSIGFTWTCDMGMADVCPGFGTQTPGKKKKKKKKKNHRKGDFSFFPSLFRQEWDQGISPPHGARHWAESGFDDWSWPRELQQDTLWSDHCPKFPSKTIIFWLVFHWKGKGMRNAIMDMWMQRIKPKVHPTADSRSIQMQTNFFWNDIAILFICTLCFFFFPTFWRKDLSGQLAEEREWMCAQHSFEHKSILHANVETVFNRSD